MTYRRKNPISIGPFLPEGFLDNGKKVVSSHVSPRLDEGQQETTERVKAVVSEAETGKGEAA